MCAQRALSTLQLSLATRKCTRIPQRHCPQLALPALPAAVHTEPLLHPQMEQPLLNLYVRPDATVSSFLTPLTGLTAELLAQHGMPLAAALATLRAALPRDAVLVGQNINADVRWLGLKEGEDFVGMVDLAGLFRVFNTQYNSWSVFGQDHVARVLLGVDSGTYVYACALHTHARGTDSSHPCALR